MYFSAIVLIVSAILLSISYNNTWKDIENIQYYSENDYIGSIQGQPQMSTQVAVNIEKLFVDPSKIYIDSISKTKFYECYNKKLNYANWNQMTINQTYDVNYQQIFVPYNGIGDWCVDATTNVTFQTSGRQPFHPNDNKNKYCYDNMQDNVLITFDTITGRDQITYVTYNTDYPGLCRKMSNGKVQYADSSVVGYRKAKESSDYKLSQLYIQSFNPQQENSLWTYVAFTALNGVLFILCLAYEIYVCIIEKDWTKAFLFKQ